MDHPEIVAGRSCGTCTLCCKVLKITELQKPKGVWCRHCKPGDGCGIYDTKPNECSQFYCLFLLDNRLGDAWKPSRSKIVLVTEFEQNRVAAHVDPAFPGRWREEPYYSTLKRWAVDAAPHQGQVVVTINMRSIVILPTEDVDLGIVGEDELIVTGETRTPSGIRLRAFKIHRDDPLAAKVIGHVPKVGE